MTELDAGDLVPPATPGRRPALRRWQPVVGLVGLAGLAVAAFTMAGDLRGQDLPGVGSLIAAFALHVVALLCAARAWVALFPLGADRRALTRSLYTSQLAKYLPAGGVLQVAGQVALSGDEAGVGAAALRLPVFSLCLVTAGATLSAGLAFAPDLHTWARVLASFGVLAPILLDRRILAGVLHLVRKVVKRLPEPATLPPQGAIVRAYVFGLGNLVAYSAAFAVLLRNVADVNPFVTAAALCAAWVVGYLVIPIPSGLGVREAVLVAALPGMTTASLLAASVAHRLLGVVAEATLAGASRIGRRRPEPAPAPGTDTGAPAAVPPGDTAG